MSDCTHQQLVLLTVSTTRLRCRHCHLTLRPQELPEGYCPECWEVRGQRQSDFEEIHIRALEGERYRCEQCGIMIQLPASPAGPV